MYWTWQDVRYLYRVDEAVSENGIIVDNLEELEGLAVDLAIALHYLHGCGLVHGNVNPCAIFRSIEPTNRLRLGSFGYLRSLEGGKRLKGISGDFEEFRAPECNDGNGEYFEEIDWFSYGKVLKFWREQLRTTEISDTKGKIEELDDLINKLTIVTDDVVERLGYGPGGFKAIQSHPFFSSTSSWSAHLNPSTNPERSAKKRNSKSLNASIESLKRINSSSGSSGDDIFCEIDFSNFLEFTWDETGEMGIMLESIIKRSSFK